MIFSFSQWGSEWGGGGRTTGYGQLVQRDVPQLLGQSWHPVLEAGVHVRPSVRGGALASGSEEPVSASHERASPFLEGTGIIAAVWTKPENQFLLWNEVSLRLTWFTRHARHVTQPLQPKAHFTWTSFLPDFFRLYLQPNHKSSRVWKQDWRLFSMNIWSQKANHSFSLHLYLKRGIFPITGGFFVSTISLRFSLDIKSMQKKRCGLFI